MTEVDFLNTVTYTLEGKDFTKQTKVKGGNLWSILSDRKLFYVNLQNPSSATVIPNLDTCMFHYVSDSGKFCLVRSVLDYYIVNAEQMSVQKIQPIPKTDAIQPIIKCVTFMTNPHDHNEYVFIGTDQGHIVYNTVQAIHIKPATT